MAQSSLKKKIVFAVGTVVLFSMLIETFFCMISARGASEFCERVILSNGLRKSKPKGELRIFLYGESTMHGCFLYPKSTPDVWLRNYLHDLLPPERAGKIKIVNFGRLGTNSDFIDETFRDTVLYKPDLAIFYFGHNDLAQLKHRKRYLTSSPLRDRMEMLVLQVARNSCFLASVKRSLIRMKMLRHARKDLRAEEQSQEQPLKAMDAEIDLLYPGSKLHDRCTKDFKENLYKIIAVAERKSVPVIFFKMISNVKDIEPFYSAHLLPLTKEELEHWNKLHSQQSHWMHQKKYRQALPLLRRMIRIDPTHAETLHAYGTCLYETGEYGRAKEFFYKAIDYDLIPIRAKTIINETYEELDAQKFPHVAVIQTPLFFEQASAHGIIANELIDDPVHPNIRGYALMARTLVKTMEQRGWLIRPGDLDWGKERPFEAMTGNLGITDDFLFDYYLAVGKFCDKFFRHRIKFIKKALGLKPASIAAKRQLAWAYWLQGNREGAKKIYLELKQRSPQTMQEIYQRLPEIKAYLESHGEADRKEGNRPRGQVGRFAKCRRQMKRVIIE